MSSGVCALFRLSLQAQLAGTPELVPEAERVAIFPDPIEPQDPLGVSAREVLWDCLGVGGGRGGGVDGPRM